MPVTEEMTRIEQTIDEAFDTHRRSQAKRKAESRLKVYRKALEEVQQIAGNNPTRELSEWIQDRIRKRTEPPSGRDVRKKGADICRERGHDVSTGSWLGA